MFSYYGSKSKIIDYYPKPKHDKVIEPFAGSARYALKYFDRDVLLVDKYEVIVKVWQYLQQCSPNDILKLPKLEQGMNLLNLNLSEEERLFLGFCVHVSFSPGLTVSKFSAYDNGNQNKFKKIAGQLYKIKHWKIKQGSFEDIPNQEATWFIDPPYQFGGHKYKKSNKDIDFNTLASWCQNREGQTIVCENTKADWLPFKPVIQIQGSDNSNTTEAIWANHKTAYQNEQLQLF